MAPSTQHVLVGILLHKAHCLSPAMASSAQQAVRLRQYKALQFTSITNINAVVKSAQQLYSIF